MSGKRTTIIYILIFLLTLVVVYAFSTGFLNGVHLLGDILNILGAMVTSLLCLIWNIPVMGQKMIKNSITTIIIILVFGSSLSKSENKVMSLVIGSGVSLVCAVLVWCNLI